MADDHPRKRKLHVVMFPWLAFGHIIPYLELSKLIAQKGHRISFLSTPRNIDRLPKLPAALPITLVKIPLPEPLPGNAEATSDIHPSQVSLLKKAFDRLEPGVTRFLESSDPDWLIYDFAPHWLPPVASRLGISRAFFMIINAWFLAFVGPWPAIVSGSDYRTKPEDYTVPPKWVGFETRAAYRRFEAKAIFESSHEAGSGVSDFYRIGRTIRGCEAILVRHCEEFEPAWLRVLEEINDRPVFPLGLMPPTPQNPNDEDEESWGCIEKWLDARTKGSVVYVALGSEVAPSQAQVVELARGLELSGVPFFWVLRKSSGSHTESDDSVGLPDEFEERVKGRGIVWRFWVPQPKILGHEAVGGFLTHCGWSSIVEGIISGHPLITLPFLVDQGLNSRVIVENKLGLEIPRNEDDGSYTRDSVAESIKAVMIEDEGKVLRERAKEMGAIFGDVELQSRYIDKFVDWLENHISVSRVEG